jgi:hypothetical protein
MEILNTEELPEHSKRIPGSIRNIGMRTIPFRKLLEG